MLLKDSLNAVPLRVSGNGSICIIQVFDPCLVAIAEENGKIVGCNHWLLRDIKVSSSSVGSAILSGDLAVHPNHRKLCCQSRWSKCAVLERLCFSS